ncbi:NUDIX hydrolase [Sulfurirhabdus autotrophica]|uniref:Phosphatase NudJ n=1 Tax=Sulfurirhabdus autotrophica TaxID=1706046 RepID=A0A4R3XVS8_9PROT|nr:NUDIX hydrolase [Sulfurirhabdus autotrophica]TCV82318.1 ADP-ribose pyrophosphatase YjhB (NUDIX family) [Sulfurirhabdus autotrophica]
MIWKPNVTVAAVIENDGQFLMVEENTSEGIQFNQPAGHLEPNESLLNAAIRETLEETAYHFKPESLLGIYRWTHPRKGVTYLRFAFIGSVTQHEADRVLDKGIIRAAWLPLDEIRGMTAQFRSPLVLNCIEDYLAGKRYSLDILTHYE